MPLFHPQELLDPEHSSRAATVRLSVLLALLAVPFFGALYVVMGDMRAAAACGAAFLGIVASALLLRFAGRIADARELLTATIFLLLLCLIFLVGGVRSPSVVWLAVCPMISAAGGSPTRGLGWIAASAVAILLIYGGSLVDWYPSVRVHDFELLLTIGNISFILLVAVFLLLYERNNSRAIAQLNSAMETIQRMATLDELTGVWNRRELIRIAEIERERAVRYGTPLSYCMIDVDHFKRVNDTYGHAVGDAVLSTIAQTVQALTRATDCFGRYGGEEFLLILSATDLKGAVGFAERVRTAVAALQIPGLQGQAVTVSVGVAQHRPDGSVQQMIASADLALYSAKHAGRNAVRASECV